MRWITLVYIFFAFGGFLIGLIIVGVALIIRAKNTGKKFYGVLASVCSFPFVVGLCIAVKNSFFFSSQITEECYVKQYPFQNKYYLSNKAGKMLVGDVYNWVISADYIYGCNTDFPIDETICFIYNRKTNDCENLIYEDFKSNADKMGIDVGKLLRETDCVLTLQDGSLPRHYTFEK